MAYPTIDSVNTSEGIHTFYTYANSVVPILTPLILFAIFIITLLGTFFVQVRARNDANFSGSFAVAGFFTTIVALFMSFIPGMINNTTLVIVFGVAILGFLWLVLSKK